jgi:hypothetical protein
MIGLCKRFRSKQQAIKDKGHTGALYSKSSDPAAEVGMALFTTALGLYGGVLWSCELQGLIVHEMVPMVPTNTNTQHPTTGSAFWWWLVAHIAHRTVT